MLSSIGSISLGAQCSMDGATFCWKNTCLYRIQDIRSRKLIDLLHLQLITFTKYISKYKNKRVYFSAVKFKTKD